MLARELRLLLLLVPVLAVVHDPADRRIGLRCDLDEIEILRERVLERLVARLDPDLAAVRVDEPHPRNADLLVDARLADGRADGLERSPTPSRHRHQVVLIPPSSNAQNGRMQQPLNLSPFSVEPPTSLAAPEVRRCVLLLAGLTA